MSRNLYRDYLLLCRKWGTDPTKKGRDLGAFIRKEVAKEFANGEQTSIRDAAECESKLRSLQRLASGVHKDRYPTRNTVGASWMTLEECRELLSTQALEEMEQQSTFKSRMRFSLEDFKDKFFSKKTDS